MTIDLKIDYSDVFLLEEIIKYLPQYEKVFEKINLEGRRKILESVIYGSLVPIWNNKIILEQNAANLGSGRTMVRIRNFLLSMHNFILKGTGTDLQKARLELKDVFRNINRDIKLQVASGELKDLRSLEAKKQILFRYFNVTYNSLLQNYSKMMEDPKFQNKNFIMRNIHRFIYGILYNYGYENITDETGKPKLGYSNTLKRMSAVGILIGIILGVGFLLLFLMTKIPIVGRLFKFLLKILTAPIRILWNGLGFILRKLKVI